ncbi:hypothetical protein DFS34DRAFT_432348 [Phlyctochytrium arcticum]|nr:hypothetical protein DFS34DRAFT_432348 [Phlyctochytrium arcticum]
MSLIPPSPPLDEPRSTKYMRTLSASSRSASADTLRHDARSLRVSQPPALRTPPTSNLRGGMGQEYIDIGKGGLGTRRPTDVTSNFFKRSGPDSSLESERLMSSIPPPHPKILSALPNRSKGTGGDSMSLVTSMAARLNQLENQLRRVQADVQIKDVKIERLQIELQRYETRKDDSSEDAEQDNRVTTLEAKCAALQAQIADMDALLRRNNMVWNDFAVNNNNNNNSNGWVNSSAAPSPIPKASYRRPFPYVMKTVVGAIAELNALAGDGVGSITTASKTHRLKMPSSLPLTLYRNGFLLRQGPFREYDEPGAKAFWRDVLDGYFPGELRPTYPDGGKLNLTYHNGCLHSLTILFSSV